MRKIGIIAVLSVLLVAVTAAVASAGSVRHFKGAAAPSLHGQASLELDGALSDSGRRDLSA